MTTNCQKVRPFAKRDAHGQLVRDNVFGTIEEDAERRDFTFNAMYYSVADFTVKDFANGLAAIEKREVELIGDPETRYREDPVRMLRAVRFAVKLSMRIEKQKPLHQLNLWPICYKIFPRQGYLKKPLNCFYRVREKKLS